ncbi:MAG: hypothetical protein ACRENW_00755, partial [Thermodesulfobacteriota bacterium]
MKSLLKDVLFIRPVDQKGIKFPLTVTNVQKAKFNYQEDSAFGNIGNHLIRYYVFETNKKSSFWNIKVRITAGSNVILNGKRKRLFDVLL